MATGYKIDLVTYVWNNSAETRHWYTTQVETPVTIDDFTTFNVREYGLTGMGELADEIIAAGVDAGIITKEQAENEAL